MNLLVVVVFTYWRRFRMSCGRAKRPYACFVPLAPPPSVRCRISHFSQWIFARHFCLFSSCHLVLYEYFIHFGMSYPRYACCCPPSLPPSLSLFLPLSLPPSLPADGCTALLSTHFCDMNHFYLFFVVCCNYLAIIGENCPRYACCCQSYKSGGGGCA